MRAVAAAPSRTPVDDGGRRRPRAARRARAARGARRRRRGPPGRPAAGRSVRAAARRPPRRPRRPRRTPARGERQHPAVQQPARQHQHVRGEPVAADVAALPHPTGSVARRAPRRPDGRAARSRCRACCARRRGRAGGRRARPAGPSSGRSEQLGVGVVRAPAQRLATVAGVDQRPPARGAARGAARPADRQHPHARPRAARGLERCGDGRVEVATRAARRGPTGRAARRAAAGRPGRPCRASGRRAAGPAARTVRADSRGCGRCGVGARPRAQTATTTPSRSSRRATRELLVRRRARAARRA